jgi:hypothetical protein
VVIYFVVSNAVRIGQQALVTKLDFSPKALAAAEAKREARLAAKGDVVDVESSVTERKGRGARGDAKRDAAAQEALRRHRPSGRDGRRVAVRRVRRRAPRRTAAGQSVQRSEPHHHQRRHERQGHPCRLEAAERKRKRK